MMYVLPLLASFYPYPKFRSYCRQLHTEYQTVRYEIVDFQQSTSDTTPHGLDAYIANQRRSIQIIMQVGILGVASMLYIAFQLWLFGEILTTYLTGA